MANLIITVIAIALVAVAAVMGAYYGGAAFLNDESAANAATVLNQAQQVAEAWNAYRNDNMNTPPSSVQQLIDGGYLSQMPKAPAAIGYNQPTGIFINQVYLLQPSGVYEPHWYAYAVVGDPNGAVGDNRGTFADPVAATCAHIIKTAIGVEAYNAEADQYLPQTGLGDISTDPVMGNGTFGCGYNFYGDNASIPLAGSTVVKGFSYVFEYLLQ